jgi:hypothetical protein
MTALRLIRALDVLHEYACALEPARALSSRPLRPFAARPDEKSGLEQPSSALRRRRDTTRKKAPVEGSSGAFSLPAG